MGRGFSSPSLLTHFTGGLAFLWSVFGNSSEKDSQVSVDSVLEKPSKAGLESRKGNFPNLAFLLFNFA